MSKVNAITSVVVAILGFTLTLIDFNTQKINGYSLKTYSMIFVKF